MSMSTYVQGFRDLDGEFARMAEVKKFCEEKGVSLPKEVEEYFGKYSLDPISYVAEQMSEIEIPKEAMSRSQDYSRDHFEIDVTKLPKELKKIRFTNSY